MTPVKDANGKRRWGGGYDDAGGMGVWVCGGVGVWGCGKKGLSEREKCLEVTQRSKGRKGILLVTYTCQFRLNGVGAPWRYSK